MSDAMKQLPFHRMLHITLNIGGGRPYDPKEWEESFNFATDWYRYAPNCWLVYTSGDADSWMKFLTLSLTSNDALLIIDISGPTVVGLLPMGAWEWLSKYMVLRDDVKSLIQNARSNAAQ